MICPKCGELNNDNNVFCLNCRYRLRDYKNIEIDGIDYNADSEELFLKLSGKFSDVCNQYSDQFYIISDFSNQYSSEISSSSDKFKSGQITYDEMIDTVIGVFDKTRMMYENYLIQSQDFALKILKIFYDIWDRCHFSNITKEQYEALVDKFIDPIAKFNGSVIGLEESFKNIDLKTNLSKFADSKGKFIKTSGNVINFHKFFINELNNIKYSALNDNSFGEEKNMGNVGFHFCMNCGAKLNPNDHFCGECGVKVGEVERQEVREVRENFPQYRARLNELKQEYELKEGRAKELIGKLFDTSKMSYNSFNSSLNNCNKLFYEQIGIAFSIIDLASSESLKLENELKNKIEVLKSIIEKLNDLIDELIIHISSNKDNSDEINAVFEDMEKLIDSVRFYE